MDERQGEVAELLVVPFLHVQSVVAGTFEILFLAGRNIFLLGIAGTT